MYKFTGTIIILITIALNFLSAGESELLTLQDAFRKIAKEVTPQTVRVDSYSAQGELITLGTGCIIEQKGGTVYVVTNTHVINRGAKLKVSLNDYTKYDAVLLGMDDRSDVAVVSFNAKENFTPVKIGNSDKIQVGDWAVSIGNPFGFNGSFTVGVVSAVGRSMYGSSNPTDYIQTDAAVNPGNSGGPLLNLNGEVVGINTWIASTTGENSGLSFAIPINLVMQIFNQIVNNKKVEYPWLGVYAQGLNNETFKNSLGLTLDKGAYITQIVEGSPADKSSLSVGDIIIAVNDREVKDSNELVWVVSKFRPGEVVTVKFIRNGTILTDRITLAVRPDPSAVNKQSQVQSADEGSVFLGAVLSENGGSVTIKSITPGTPASESGLKQGDKIIRINKIDIKNMKDIDGIKSDKNIKFYYFTILRNNREMIIGVTTGE